MFRYDRITDGRGQKRSGCSQPANWDRLLPGRRDSASRLRAKPGLAVFWPAAGIALAP